MRISIIRRLAGLAVFVLLLLAPSRAHAQAAGKDGRFLRVLERSGLVRRRFVEPADRLEEIW